MSKNEVNILEQMANITDSLVDNIIMTPDEEILDEVKSEYGDPSYEANKMLKIIQNAKIESNRNKFRKAKNELNEFKNKEKVSSENSIDFNDEDLTIAARDGKYISEEDKKSINEDLNDLKDLKDFKE